MSVTTEGPDLRRAARRASLERARALQHRRRRLRQAPARQARDDLGGLARQRAPRRAGASCRTSRPSSRTCCASTASSAGTVWRCCCRPRPRPRPPSSAPGRLGAILLSMSVLYGDEGIRHRIEDSQAKVLVTDADNADRIEPRPGRAGARSSTTGCSPTRPRNFETVDTAADDPAPALLLLRHDRARQGHPARAPLPARPRGVRLLPRRARRRALPRHGRVGLGRGHRAAARALAAGRDAVRLPARGRLRPRAAARRALQARGRRTSSRRRPRCAR